MSDQFDIVHKIQRLLALSKSDNINEATNAAAIANKYIIKYRLKEEDYLPQNVSLIFDDPESIYESARVTAWKLDLLTLIAKHYGCAIYNDKFLSENGRNVSKYRLIGRENDVKFTKSMFNWVISEIQKHTNETCKGHGSLTHSSYCKGAVKGIENFLEQTRSEQRQMALASGQASALSRIENREQEALEYMYKKYNVAKPLTKPKVDPEAYQRGYDVGAGLGKSFVSSEV